MTSLLSLDDLRSMIGSARGRAGAPLACHYVRDLTEDDMEQLLHPEPVGSTTPLLKRLRSHHHHIAKLCADGEKDVQVAAITGMSISRISLLRQDPAFQELVTYYQAQAEAKYLDVHERLANLGTAVIEELTERLEEAPENFSHKELRELGEFVLDRSVAPPKSRMSDPRGGLPAISISFHAGTGVPLLSQQAPTIEAEEALDLVLALPAGSR